MDAKLLAAKAWMQARGITGPRVLLGHAVVHTQRNIPSHDMSILQRALLDKRTK